MGRRSSSESEQPPLFSIFDLPTNPKLAGLAKDWEPGKWKHTGAGLLSDEELCELVCTDILSGLSQRAVARKYGISRNSITPVMEELESRGKLEPLKRRLSRKLGIAFELSVETAIEMLEEGRVPANVIPVMGGVFADKKALIDGEPTSIGEVRIETTAEAFLKKLEAARSRLIECHAPPALPEPTTDAILDGMKRAQVVPEPCPAEIRSSGSPADSHKKEGS